PAPKRSHGTSCDPSIQAQGERESWIRLDPTEKEKCSILKQYRTATPLPPLPSSLLPQYIFFSKTPYPSSTMKLTVASLVIAACAAPTLAASVSHLQATLTSCLKTNGCPEASLVSTVFQIPAICQSQLAPLLASATGPAGPAPVAASSAAPAPSPSTAAAPVETSAGPVVTSAAAVAGPTGSNKTATILANTTTAAAATSVPVASASIPVAVTTTFNITVAPATTSFAPIATSTTVAVPSNTNSVPIAAASTTSVGAPAFPTGQTNNAARSGFAMTAAVIPVIAILAAL
ncbi:hypothetical protein BDK51DRAFT_32075, partial [Blyttiomyces helicus]